VKRILQLVDTVDYVRGNCFQHQLAHSLGNVCELVQVELKQILWEDKAPEADGIVCCLKQRTVDKHLSSLKSWLNGQPIVIYDQDPWEAYKDDSPYKDAYHRSFMNLNVRSFALTTEWWVDFLQENGLPSMFVKMGVLPTYCNENKPYLERSSVAGFVGTVHPRRKELIDIVEKSGIHVAVGTNSLSYPLFLKEIGKIRCFIHNEDMEITVDGKKLNFNTGMWVKDIEAASQGCFSIRSAAQGSESYLQGVPTVKLYEHIDQVPDIIRSIENMDPVERQDMINKSVQFIRSSDEWTKTATLLVEQACRK